jgi:hypothetical protein
MERHLKELTEAPIQSAATIDDLVTNQPSTTAVIKIGILGGDATDNEPMPPASSTTTNVNQTITQLPEQQLQQQQISSTTQIPKADDVEVRLFSPLVVMDNYDLTTEPDWEKLSKDELIEKLNKLTGT